MDATQTVITTKAPAMQVNESPSLCNFIFQYSSFCSQISTMWCKFSALDLQVLLQTTKTLTFNEEKQSLKPLRVLLLLLLLTFVHGFYPTLLIAHWPPTTVNTGQPVFRKKPQRRHRHHVRRADTGVAYLDGFSPCERSENF